VIEAEFQAVMNTLADHDFQDATEKCQETWKLCISPEGDYF
jgi:hypothetical protein